MENQKNAPVCIEIEDLRETVGGATPLTLRPVVTSPTLTRPVVAAGTVMCYSRPQFGGIVVLPALR